MLKKRSLVYSVWLLTDWHTWSWWSNTSCCVYSYRVTTRRQNLNMSGNFTAVRDLIQNQRSTSGKSW